MAATTETIGVPAARVQAALQVRTPLQDTIRKLSRHRSFRVGGVMLLFLIFVALFANVLAPYDPIKPLRTVKRRAAPCIHLIGCPASEEEHVMGIDGNSRDLFSRIIF